MESARAEVIVAHAEVIVAHTVTRALWQAKSVDTDQLVGAYGAEVVVRAGEALYVPAWWAYQIYFEEEEVMTSTDEHATALAVSVVTSWDASTRFSELPLRPSLRVCYPNCPLPSPIAYVPAKRSKTASRLIGCQTRHACQVELARDVHNLVADTLGTAQHVQSFMRALCLQMDALGDTHTGSAELVGRRGWEVADRVRPSDVAADAWSGLLQWIFWRLSLLLGPHQVAPFVRDLGSASL